MTKACIILPYHISLLRSSARTIDACLEETTSLTKAIDLELIFCETVKLNKILPSTYLGSGYVDKLRESIEDNKVEVVIMDASLAPIQQRNLENKLKCKVIDRTALILEIFGARANTKEGKLQVDLALQEYQKSRLVRSWTHLERQRGGAGFMGGPGEKQIESDRRQINERIAAIKRQLKKVVKTRSLHRESRRTIPYQIVALVGYTNAGKSTLFNLLTDAKVLAEDKLFATLDPTMRLVKLPSGNKVIFSDTVGFISNLPTELVAAFRATLEEVVEADLILHVRDIANPDTKEQKKDVIEIMQSLVKQDKIDNHTIEVLNKIDLLNKDEADLLSEKKSDKIAISSTKGQGIELLLHAIDQKLSQGDVSHNITLQVEDGQKLAWLYENSKVINRSDNEDNIKLDILISKKNLGKLQKM